MQLFWNIFRGAAVGVANVIPGVSGGTMLLVLGVYERVIRAIRNIRVSTLTSVFRGKQALGEALRDVDALFLGTLACGALLAVIASAKVIVHLLQRQHDPTYGFFFGLVLASVAVPWRMIRRRGVGVALSALIGVACVVGLTFAMSGEQRLASARQKAAIKASKTTGPTAAQRAKSSSVRGNNLKVVAFAAAGAIAIAAMILPGISGSFMLLVMGIYFDVLMAVNQRNIALLGVFALGCLVGLLAFTRLLNFLLQRFHDQTMGFLLGLVFGSLWALWPFKSFDFAGDTRVDLHNIWPAQWAASELLTVGMMLAGGAIVVAFMRLDRAKGELPTAT